jgi:hypothetical protein
MNHMIHSCVIYNASVQDQKLVFGSGSKIFTVGKTCTGAMSHAHGVVKSLTHTSGSWATSNEVGYLVLSNVVGTFGSSETINDNGTVPGVAVTTATNVANTDIYGVISTTNTSSTYACRFVPGGTAIDHDSGARIIKKPAVILLPSAIVAVGDVITVLGENYTASYIREHYDSARLHHYTVEMEAAD